MQNLPLQALDHNLPWLHFHHVSPAEITQHWLHRFVKHYFINGNHTFFVYNAVFVGAPVLNLVTEKD